MRTTPEMCATLDRLQREAKTLTGPMKKALRWMYDHRQDIVSTGSAVAESGLTIGTFRALHGRGLAAEFNVGGVAVLRLTDDGNSVVNHYL